jgi:hypothetical protein
MDEYEEMEDPDFDEPVDTSKDKPKKLSDPKKYEEMIRCAKNIIRITNWNGDKPLAIRAPLLKILNLESKKIKKDATAVIKNWDDLSHPKNIAIQKADVTLCRDIFAEYASEDQIKPYNLYPIKLLRNVADLSPDKRSPFERDPHDHYKTPFIKPQPNETRFEEMYRNWQFAYETRKEYCAFHPNSCIVNLLYHDCRNQNKYEVDRQMCLDIIHHFGFVDAEKGHP